MHARELAKFASGFAFNESLGHWWLGIWGSSMLPWKIGSFTFTSQMNTISMIAWPMFFALLVYIGWFAGRRQAAPRSLAT